MRTFWVRGKCIGRGSFGTVHLAAGINHSADHVFAVKSVRRDTGSSTASMQQPLECLENEIAILRTLCSPFVVRYLGDDTTWEDDAASSFRNLHMEYMPGGTLADLAAGPQLDDRILRSYVRCLVSALSYLHARSITHCDVKGRNVLVGPGVGTCKLADFGSARTGVSIGESSPRGSPMWMAPEVIRGEYQGPESDVWSLGCTVIEMMTGRPGWEEDKGAADTLCRIGFTEELPWVPSRMSEVGRDFLSKCLNREVSERWSCDQLLRHPFVSSSSPCLLDWDASPRGVLDWAVGTECAYDDDEADSDCGIQHRQYEDTNRSTEVKSRIRELAAGNGSDGGAFWELAEGDGWLAVRGWDGVPALEYSNAATTTTTGAEEETQIMSLAVAVNFGGNKSSMKIFNLGQRGQRCRGNVLKCDVTTARIIAEAAAGSHGCRHGDAQNIGHLNCSSCCYFNSIQFNCEKCDDAPIYFGGNHKYLLFQFVPTTHFILCVSNSQSTLTNKRKSKK